MKRTNCLTCGSQELTKVLDLGMQAFADTFVDNSRSNDVLPVYDLSCVLCKNCGMVQTSTITSANERYNMFDYSYTSSNSKVAKNHWLSYAENLTKTLNLSNSQICEIGSNDGFLLNIFQSLGNEVLGIDASKHMTKIANKNGVKTVSHVFDENITLEKLNYKSSFDLVVANNVFNHSDNPLSFIKGVYNLLKVGGTFVFEVPYWKCTIDSKKIDQIYHEHVTYFTATSVKNMIKKFNFIVSDIEVVDYHGGSLRLQLQKIAESEKKKHNNKLASFIEEEKHLFDIQTYKNLKLTLDKMKLMFLKDIVDNKLKGVPLVAIGAAAKGNTLLNYLNLNATIVDWVTDASDFKQGKKTPLSNIPICSDDILRDYKEVSALLLCWNLSSFVKQKLLEINPNIKFINFYEDYA